MITDFLIRVFVNPFAWKYLLGSRRFEILEALRESQWNSLEVNLQEQARALFELVTHAHTHVPYYSRVMAQRDIHYSEETIFEDIKQFPILTKDLIREHFEELQSTDPDTRRRKPHHATSGGSTGEPVLLVHDRVTWDRSSATKMLFNEWAGRREGQYMIALWGSEREILEGGQGLKGFLRRHFKNFQLLNAFKMSERDMRGFVTLINTKKPVVILAYVQSIEELARFIERHGLSVYSPEGIITSAGTLDDEIHRTIERVFRCPVFNRYGSREVGDMACSCEKGEGLHLNIFSHYVEVLDADGIGVEPGQTGEIHVTTLHNLSMPLIRYAIGDVARTSAAGSSCSCGRGMPLLDSIQGRTVNLFRTADGDVVDGSYMTRQLHRRSWCKQYQVIQEDYTRIRIKVVLHDGTSFEKDVGPISRAIKSVMGGDCSVVFEEVDCIAPTESGKFLHTISMVDRNRGVGANVVKT